MADYSGAYERPASKEEIENYQLKKRIGTLEAELKVYKDRDRVDMMKRLDYAESEIDGHVECNKCFAMVREVNMPGHRDRCK